MSFSFFSKNKNSVPWADLSAVSQLDEIEKESFNLPVIILKHSTRCSISSMAKNRLELYWDPAIDIKPYYLDLLNHRDISDEIARRYGVKHESPQVLLFRNGTCIYHESHNGIDYNQLKSQL